MAKHYYSGKFRPINISKYSGDYTAITYRSLWERQFMKWLDTNSSVVLWSSEEIIIPYICRTDSRQHRYFLDFKVTFSNGKTLLIEIKPKIQTIQPKKPARQTKRFLTEVITYTKNISKWSAADIYAQQRGWEFVVWTEHDLTDLGIKLILEKAPKPKKKKI